jgi:tetratricopeptide (TPR) repeat protein
MTKTCKHLLLLAVLIPAVMAYAQSPREQLNQLVEQLRSNPSDNTLRERIIKLAQEIKPPPAVPEEAERRMARGTAAFQGARSQRDYEVAAQEFEVATNAAPWLADVYFNLGMTHDKAGNYAAAISNLRLALLANPDNREIKSLLYQVEFRAEQASLDRIKRERETQEALRSIAGEWTQSAYADNMNFVIQKIGDRYDVRWVGQGLGYRIQSATDQQFSYQLDQGLQQTYGTCALSSDGQILNCRARIVQNFPGGSSGETDPWSYRRVP